MENNKCYLGLDVGKLGYIVAQCNGAFSSYAIKDHTLYELSDYMADLRAKYENIICVIEDVHAIHNSSAKGTFNFGLNKGELLGLLCANKIPYVLVAPKEWQSEMWSCKDVVVKYKKCQRKNKKTGEVTEYTKKETDTKATSIKAAQRLFPNMDFRRTTRCIEIDDNKVDATLMSEYGRRKNL